jgi:periplasmic protein CpxP/Spy
MTEQVGQPSGPETGATPPRTCRGRGRGRAAVFIILVALVGGIAGGLATRAFGQAPWHAAAFMGGMGGPIDPARLDQNIERMTRHFAIEVDATVEQQAKLAVIAKAAAQDLLPLREQAQHARQEGLDLLAAPTVDRAGIERLRAAQIQLAEQASKRLAQAIADVADVLTPEQRKALAEHISQGPWSRWHRG